MIKGISTDNADDASNKIVVANDRTPREAIAYFPFNGNAKDQSGNNNNGIVYDAGLSTDRFGNPESAYFFDGNDDYISVPDAEELRLTHNISISVWFKTDYALPYASLVCKSTPNEPRNGYVIDIDEQNRIRADLMYDHSTATGVSLTSNSQLTDNKWHHVVVVYNGNNAMLYIDNQLITSANYSRGMRANTEPLLIGWDKNNWKSHRHFYGSIDDIRIYNRALNGNEVRNLFNEK